MSLHAYGVLKGRIHAARRATHEDPHVHLHIIADETSYRASINVRSRHAPSILEYAAVEQFHHRMLAPLSLLPVGFTPLLRRPGGCALDYIRGQFVAPATMRPLPFDRPGPANDLNDLFEQYVHAVTDDPDGRVYVFGAQWGPIHGCADAVFGFTPGRGVHNVHMNQASGRHFRATDGVWQDGAVFFSLPQRSHWIAVFLKFQSQAWRSDGRTGRRVARRHHAVRPRR